MKLFTIINALPKLYKISFVTVLAVYFLIAVGGIVRSTGAGMGCPDWPKCFGSWVPPTSEAQLPPQYQDYYVQVRVEKNERLAGTLASLGFEDKADEILNDPAVRQEQAFNATKTWIEYINRLVGVVIGFLILGTFLSSIKYLRSRPSLTLFSFIALVLVLFQAWVGSLVVSTNLLEWMITVHMLLALLIVGILIWIYYRAEEEDPNYAYDGSIRHHVKPVALLFLIMLVGQVILGTQVREEVDAVIAELGYSMRSTWVESLGIGFKIHRSYSIGLVLVFAMMVRTYMHGFRHDNRLRKVLFLLACIMAVSILTGVIMAYFSIPAFAQPLHLLLGSLLVGIQYYFVLYVGRSSRLAQKNQGISELTMVS
jgi:cytochrome c oxidase assembly protein subunit 15